MTRLPKVFLSNKFHRNRHAIFIDFGFDWDLIKVVKTIPGVLWSARHKQWYVSNTSENLKAIFKVFDGMAEVDSTKLFEAPGKKVPKVKAKSRHLSEANKSLLNGFYSFLRGKRYSTNTIKTYTYLTGDFVAFYNDKDLDRLTNRDVELFIESVVKKRDYAISTQRQFISAIKQFTLFYPACQIDSATLFRPKKSKILPTVLSKMELLNLMRCTRNIKHRAIIGLMYSAGLRVSELINLELRDLYIGRRQLHIKNAKGRKDRYVVLSEGFLPLLENYLLSYKPERYFVEGQTGQRYSDSSIRKFLHQSAKAAGIHKRVTPHTLRHSYATHLLEQGVGLRHIQELLGHVKPETTMIYTHVAKKDLLDIKSPLDHILMEIQNGDNLEDKFLLSGE